MIAGIESHDRVRISLHHLHERDDDSDRGAAVYPGVGTESSMKVFVTPAPIPLAASATIVVLSFFGICFRRPFSYDRAERTITVDGSTEKTAADFSATIEPFWRT